MVSKPIQDLLATYYQASRVKLQMSSLGHEGGVLKVSHWMRYGLKMSLCMGGILQLTLS